MLKIESEVDNLKNEIECLRKENEYLKQQLGNYNHSTIHNNSNINLDMSDISQYEEYLKEQPNYFADSLSEIEETKVSNDEVNMEFNRLILGL